MDWYKRNSSHYRQDTWHLSLAAHGAYSLLIDYYMQHETSIPENDQAIASIIGRPVEDWISVKHEVLPFFKARGGKLRHKRCDEEIEASFEKRRDGAKRKAKYIASKSLNNNNTVTRSERGSNTPRGEERREDKNTPPLVPPVGKKNTKTKLPDDWEPNAKAFSVGHDEGYTSDEVNWSARGFTDHWRGEGTKRANWDLSFYKWLRSDITRRGIRERRKDNENGNSNDYRKDILEGLGFDTRMEADGWGP